MELFKLLFLSTLLAFVTCSALTGSPTSIDHGGPTLPASASSAASLSIGHVEPVKPIIDRREALDLGVPPAPSPVDTAIPHPLPAEGCTTTMTESVGNPCTWDGTQTVYPSTTVLYQQVDCNGCDHIVVKKGYNNCPNQRISATARAATPSTSWSTVCRPSANLAQRAEQRTPAIPKTAGSDAARPTVKVSTPAVTAFPTTNHIRG
ncbi:hypothetical protein VTK56DRAFT_1202 [Thermocarpiscus australiensis]